MAIAGKDFPIKEYHQTVYHYHFYIYVPYLKELGFEWLGTGSFRTTYSRGNIVIKVPHNSRGVIDNQVEAYTYAKYRNDITKAGHYVAPCHLLPNGCLMMKKLDLDCYPKPRWANTLDGSQVGTYQDRFLAYDYALDEPSERGELLGLLCQIGFYEET